jgi:glycosyltransferase involved in cell wall biosynthesis
MLARKKRIYTIVMLVENLSVPADPRVWREARTLHAAGFRVCIICPRGRTRDQKPEECIDGIFIYRYRLSPTTEHPLSYLREYIEAMIQTFLYSLRIWLHHGFDVIHAANPPDLFFFIGLFYRLFGKKYVFDQHDLAPEVFQVKFHNRQGLLYHLMLLLERCSYWTAHLVITTNESQRQIALTRGKCRPQSVVVVRSGPELDRYRPDQPDTTLKHNRRYLLLYVGVMGAQDGIEYALHAMKELVHDRQHNDISLALLGEGERLPALQELAHTLHLDAYVNFTGWVDQTKLMRYLNSADIGLCPDSSNELNDRCTMLKTLEYMAMGKPIVAFNLPETRYSAQEAALYAPSQNVTAFADCIELLLEQENLRKHMGLRGRQRIVEELCWDRTKEALLSAYAALLPASSVQQTAKDTTNGGNVLNVPPANTTHY